MTFVADQVRALKPCDKMSALVPSYAASTSRVFHSKIQMSVSGRWLIASLEYILY